MRLPFFSSSPPVIPSNGAPDTEKAREYVNQQIFGRGGFSEAVSGLRHKTLPFIVGIEKSLTAGKIIALLLRFSLAAVTALFPVLVRKILSRTDKTTEATVSINDLLPALVDLILPLSSVDILIMLVALTIYFAPKVIEALDKKTPTKSHLPYYSLTDAINKMPRLQGGNGSKSQADEAIKQTLNAVCEEMSLLIGEEPTKKTTEAILLVFGDSDGSKMLVRMRSEATKQRQSENRPIDSQRLMAYYVAKIGRAYAEQDFLKKNNPFPKFRTTIATKTPVNYRSILFIPIITSSYQNTDDDIINGIEHPKKAPPTDCCLGVLCIQSNRAYRFWRWGDHTKGVGGFSDVACERAMPYIALIERLLEDATPKVPLEAT